MNASQVPFATVDELAPLLLATLQRLGELGRDGAVALARIVDDGDVNFDEAADWIATIADGGLRE